MWDTIDELAPEEQKEYVIWVRVEHSGHEFPCFSMKLEGDWFVNGRDIDLNDWECVAWYDIPPYRVVKEPENKVESLKKYMPL
jgi:hypothetical protein